MKFDDVCVHPDVIDRFRSPLSQEFFRGGGMLKSKVLLPVVLATAAGTPYLVMEDDWSAGAKQQIASMWSEEGEADEAADAVSLPDVGAPPPVFRPEFAHGDKAESPRAEIHDLLGGPPVYHVGEVLRFDISPAWVTGRWPRVTTTLSEQGMEGLRVPLVTGTRPHDLAGSLTYYFDNQQRVQRLTFEGYTGDAGQLVAVITQHYRLQAEPTLHAGMYVARWNGHPTSVVRITRAPIITHDSPRSQLQILVELNRPSEKYGLSPQVSQLLDQDHHTNRW